MATIREKRAGVWEVRVFVGYDGAGRPKQASRTVRGTKRDAQRVAAELTVKPPKRESGHTVAEVLDLWVEMNEATWAPTTRRDQRSRAERIKGDPIGRKTLTRLEVADVDRWHARLRKAGVGEGTTRNQHTALSAALSQAVRWGWAPTNVAAAARLHQPRRAPRESMTLEDVVSVLTAARLIDPAAELALRIAAVTGARRAELAALKWTDLKGDKLTIDSAIAVEERGERGIAGTSVLVDAPTKTGNRRRMTLDADTVGMIERLRDEREHCGPWMFALDERPPSPDRIGWWWQRARELSSIDKSWRLHDLRHWSATMAIAGGHDVRTVANRLGHANPAMTLRVYAHAVEAADEALAASFGRMLDP